MNGTRRGVASRRDGHGAGAHGIYAQDPFARALRHFQAGRLAEAEAGLRRLVAADPCHANGLHLLGAIATRAGRHDAAIELIGRAAAARPSDAPIQVSLGNALMDGGRLDAGVECYRRAVALRPGFVDAHINLGLALQQRGDREAAAACYRHLLSLRPDLADAHFNLGNVLYDQGRLDDAAEYYRRAAALEPSFAKAHYNLGKANRDRGQPEAAAAAYRQAIALKPDFLDAYLNLGLGLGQMGNLEEAAACFQRAIAIAPASADAHLNLGHLHRKQHRFDEAAACYRRAIAIKPDFAEAHYNLGLVLDEAWGAIDDRVECYRRAIAIAPDHADAHYKLAFALHYDRDGLDAAIASARRALELKPESVEFRMLLADLRAQACDWEGAEAAFVHGLDLTSHDAEIPPFRALTRSACPEAHLAFARRWAARTRAPAERFAHTLPFAGRRLRLGYLSADFRTHPVAYLAAELFERHDRRRFEIFGYSLCIDDGSAIRRRLEKGFDRFVDLVSLSDAEAAGRIHADGIDILVDLTGYTWGARTEILAARPAPIQVNWLGYPGTMGADFMDYILVDAFAVPPEHQPFFAEKLVHLPHCYQPNDTVREIAQTIPTRAECGLPEGAFVFCCFNNSYKITEHFFALWMELLAALPDSVLWLLGDEPVRRNLCGQAAARGIDPARLVFAPRRPLPEHLARHRLADLFLDTLPYNAHTTASDALWAGLPVLTQAGECFPGRVAGSLLHAVGLPELVTTSEEEYRALALRLVRESELLRQYRQRLSLNRATAPLFDTGRFTRDIEAAYERMVEIRRAGLAPEPIEVAALHRQSPAEDGRR